MKKEGCPVAVLLLVFNRPEPTEQVWEILEQVKPLKIYIAADGPRPNKPDEATKIAHVRSLVQPNWPCEVTYWFQNNNLGCRNHVSQAISRFFEHEERGIILEDDCLPAINFFSFCEQLLDYYQDDTRIMHISGDNFQHGIQRGNASYYFSRFNHIWGWATWRRAWKHYDVNIPDFPEFYKQKALSNILSDTLMRFVWYKNFHEVYSGKDTWDFQWTYTIWKNNGLAILPQHNLVTNIGFNQDATHTRFKVSRFSELPRNEIATENLMHPSWIMPDVEADNYTFYQVFMPGWRSKAKIWFNLLTGR